MKAQGWYFRQKLSQNDLSQYLILSKKSTNPVDLNRANLIDMNNLAASARILWGAAFSLAILKTIKVNIRLGERKPETDMLQ